MKLLIVYPTRGRVNLFFETLENVQSTIGTNNYEIIVNADNDDFQMNNANVIERVKSYRNVRMFFDEPVSKVSACNRNIDKSDNWDWVLTLSDDFKFVVTHWYEKMIEKIKSVWKDGLDFFAHFSDGFVHEKLPTMSIMGRDYYLRFDYIYHPSYGSMSCDADQMFVAMMLGRHHYFPDIYFHHLHPSNLNIPSDATYRGNDKFGHRDTMNYFERMKNLFYVENPICIPFQEELNKLK